MRVYSHLRPNCTLYEFSNKMTHREFKLWLRWLDDNYNKPSLSDYYMMQIAAEVRRVLSKNPDKIKLKDFLLSFDTSDKKEKGKKKVDKPSSIQAAANYAKAKWFAITGYKPNKDSRQ